MEMIVQLHSGLRWLVVLLLILALAANLSGWLGRRSAGPLDRALNSGLLGALGLQLVVGLVLLIGKRHDGQSFEHATVMVVAVGLAHLSIRWRKLGEAERFRKLALLQLVVLALLYFGVWRITGHADWPVRFES